MRILLALLALLVMGPAAAVAQHIRVSERVFLIPDRPGSTTRFEMIVNAGSSDEAEGKVIGVAHYLEHLVLVGRNAGHTDAAVRMFADGSSNGWTNDRATVFLHTLPARPEGPAADLERLFTFYAARLRDFSITEADATRERNVVLQEHDLRIQSNPTSLFYREFNRQLIPDHPSGTWTIGARETIRAMTLEDARAFHQTWYAPNNVWFVVRGDITPEVLKAMADKALADVPARPLPARVRDRQPTVEGLPPDFRMRSPDVSRPLVAVSQMVRIEEKDRIRAQGVASLLGAFANSRFSRSAFDQLVEVQRVASDDFSIWVRRIAPSTYAISLAATVGVDKTPDDLKAAMIAYINLFAVTGLPDEAHLARLKQRMLDQIRRADQPAQIHGRLVSWLADDRPPERFDQWPRTITGITLADLTALATAIGGGGRQMTAILEPGEAAP